MRFLHNNCRKVQCYKTLHLFHPSIIRTSTLEHCNYIPFLPPVHFLDSVHDRGQSPAQLQQIIHGIQQAPAHLRQSVHDRGRAPAHLQRPVHDRGRAPAHLQRPSTIVDRLLQFFIALSTVDGTVKM